MTDCLRDRSWGGVGPTVLLLGHWLLLLALLTHWGRVLMSSRGIVEKQCK